MKLKLLLSTSLILCKINLEAQYCTSDTRYSEQEFFNSSQIKTEKNIVFAKALNYLGQMDTMRLNVFYPKLTVDPSPKRPFILLMHPGGLYTGSRGTLDDECEEFAKRGFVAATIDYRLGFNCNNDALAFEKAAYRAAQDAHAALRYAVANATGLRLDTAWMFIGGASAGAGISLSLAFISQAEWNITRPTFQGLFGDINNSGNNLTNTFSIKGIFSNWNGVAKEFIQISEMKPTIFFHGDADTNSNIDSAYNYSCSNPPLVYGSRTLYRELTNAGVCSDLNVKIGGGHGVYVGTPAQNAFRIGKACCFFKSIFCNTCVSVSTTDSIPANCSAVTGVSEEKEKTVLLYPNPTNGKLNVEIQDQKNEFKIIVLDILGQQKLISENNSIIDLSSLPIGVYILQIQQGLKKRTYKVVKE